MMTNAEQHSDELDADAAEIVGTLRAGDAGSLSEPNKDDDAVPELDAAAELLADDPAEKGALGDDADDDAIVGKLRRENATYRARAKQAQQHADELARELWHARVSALGILADPTDLTFDAELLADVDGIRDAAYALTDRKPHLRRRVVVGGLGQQQTGSAGVSLAELLRANC